MKLRNFLAVIALSLFLGACVLGFPISAWLQTHATSAIGWVTVLTAVMMPLVGGLLGRLIRYGTSLDPREALLIMGGALLAAIAWSTSLVGSGSFQAGGILSVIDPFLLLVGLALYWWWPAITHHGSAHPTGHAH